MRFYATFSAETPTFTTLMLFQLFNVVNARSDERSAFVHLFTNQWLWAAMGGSLALQVMVVYRMAETREGSVNEAERSE